MLTGDDGSETESVPDELFERLSPTAADTVEGVQYAQDTSDRYREFPLHYRPSPDAERLRPYGGGEGSDDDESDGDNERENRFEGPAGTWRFYTESERALAASLDQERANDLTIHLFNAHALKARLRDPASEARLKHHHSKERWIGSDGDGILPWHPDPGWTAWPLKPDDVPRKGEGLGAAILSREDERTTYRMPESWKPSADLEREIQAIMMRTIKNHTRERGRQRKLQADHPSHKVSKQLSPRKRRRSRSRALSTGDSSGESSRIARRSPLVNNEQPAVDHRLELDVVMDDEEATKILQPCIQHTLTKLDDLLLALHRSRRGHAKTTTSPRSQSKWKRRKQRATENASATKAAGNAESDGETTNDQDATPRSTSEAPSQVHSSDDKLNDALLPARKMKSKVRQRGRPKNANDAARPVNSTKAKTVGSPAPTVGEKKKRKPPLSPRDWSEVLGVACLSDWDPAVLQRAADRCSALFSESMTFSVLDKASERSIGELADNLDGFVAADGDVQGYSCPVETCSRHNQPWPAKKTWRWREHLKRSHRYLKEDIQALEAGLKMQAGLKKELIDDEMSSALGRNAADETAASKGTT